MTYSLLHLPQEERPRERLHSFGVEALSTAELIAIVLGSGTKGCSVLQLAHEILAHFGGLQGIADATIAELCHVKGLGQAKAIQLKAAFGLGNRFARQPASNKFRIENPVHAYNLVKDLIAHEKREFFLAILLDVKSQVITHETIAIGTLSQALVHPREVFYSAIRHKAAGLILAHNHPSGDPTPSKEDYEVTQILSQAGALLSIPIRDHIIVGSHTYTSLRQRGFSF